MQWEVLDSDGIVLPSDVFEVLESTERVRRDRLGIQKSFMLVLGHVKSERAVEKTRSWKVLSWKVRHEIGKNDDGKFGLNLESPGQSW